MRRRSTLPELSESGNRFDLTSVLAGRLCTALRVDWACGRPGGENPPLLEIPPPLSVFTVGRTLSRAHSGVVDYSSTRSVRTAAKPQGLFHSGRRTDIVLGFVSADRALRRAQGQFAFKHPGGPGRINQRGYANASVGTFCGAGWGNPDVRQLVTFR